MATTYNNHLDHPDNNHEDLINYELLVYGINDLSKQFNDTVSAALSRYMTEAKIGVRKLSRMTGIPNGTISRYLHGTLKYDSDYLCAICIALRLHPCRQRHLFTMLEINMPDERGKDRNRAYIIREFLDGCFYNESYTVAICNKRLVNANMKALTSRFPLKEDK